MNYTTNDSFTVLEETTSKLSPLQRIITLSLLITCAIPSLICSLIIFYYFIRLRKTLLFDRINHHVILIILICDFLLIMTELPFTLQYLALGRVETTNICLFWIYWDYVLESMSLFLTMYASIERYLLVFHKPSMIKYKVLLHYIPMGLVWLYAFSINTYFVLLVPCGEDHQFDLNDFVCGGACYLNDFVDNIYDTIVDVMVPPFILLIFTLLLIVRVIINRRRIAPSAHVANTWKKNRRMVLQLLAISLMSLTTWIPWVTIILGEDFIGPSFAERFISIAVHYLPYFTSCASPFLALIGFPEIREKFKRPALEQRTRTVHAIGSMIT